MAAPDRGSDEAHGGVSGESGRGLPLTGRHPERDRLPRNRPTGI